MFRLSSLQSKQYREAEPGLLYYVSLDHQWKGDITRQRCTCGTCIENGRLCVSRVTFDLKAFKAWNCLLRHISFHCYQRTCSVISKWWTIGIAQSSFPSHRRLQSGFTWTRTDISSGTSSSESRAWAACDTASKYLHAVESCMEHRKLECPCCLHLGDSDDTRLQVSGRHGG